MANDCEQGRANRDLIERIERSIQSIKDEMTKKFDDVWDKFDVLMGRPTWIVTTVISLLATAVGTLSTFIVCNSHKLF